jgi:hypothetical protein
MHHDAAVPVTDSDGQGAAPAHRATYHRLTA